MTHSTVITVNNLKTFIYANERCNKALNGVSFSIKRGKTLCVVGESGCGKSVTASSIMQLLPELARIEEGEIIYHSEEGDISIHELPRNGKKMRSLRGSEIAMIFQDPMSALNPVYTIGFQIVENLRQHRKMSRKEAKKRAVELLREMGIPMPEQRFNEYPHQFSGGMRQRAMIAMALACEPKVLIADEPTTALDVTIQAQIFELMRKLQEEHGTAIMMITHDMGAVAELADEVAVMYMGYIVEQGTAREVFQTPAHPYTKALLESIPVLGRGRDQKLEPIQGSTPDPYQRPAGCQFQPRCAYATEACLRVPDETDITATHRVSCWHYERVIAHGE